MTQTMHTMIRAAAFLSLAACGAEKTDDFPAHEEVELAKTVPEVSFKPGGEFDGTGSAQGAPYSISYRIIGTPIVGRPVTVDLRLVSALAPRSVTLRYRINDASAMTFSESQADSIVMEPAANEAAMTQQVTLIPQRDGRLFLNVSASFETEKGTISTVAAIPIQVGTGSRELLENGAVERLPSQE